MPSLSISQGVLPGSWFQMKFINTPSDKSAVLLQSALPMMPLGRNLLDFDHLRLLPRN